MTTFLPEEGEEVMFTNCADVPYEIKLSDEENFEVINRSSKFFIYFEFELRIFCFIFQTKLTISINQHLNFSCFRQNQYSWC